MAVPFQIPVVTVPSVVMALEPGAASNVPPPTGKIEAPPPTPD